ncbi:histidinol phosphatase [Pedobacter sp. MC2016-14]|uniref:tyrosine-protein phosphatase n=1 Tax=Pedobacter sp. MC2016-14 TaxID=2897327 RepID=UPI001E4A01E3|nr:CpsB/CapC family capsule biosynthesis tyrosine phosphatase [Pedobacter sp. MC2016-14]MCD0486873.1 histidinol phosphatase [Pedobacter sp. MC2016-14]
MFSFFRKKSKVYDIEWLGVDMHSHLLPGIDDGSPDTDTSVGFINGLKDLGFTKFLCTPHIFTELYPNTRETIEPALKKLKEGLKNANLAVTLGAGAEYMVDETFKITDNLMALPGNYVLIEMSYLNESPNIEQVIFDLHIKGYHVILAHPERYNFYHHDYKKFHRFKDMGVLFQLNLLSVMGYYGKEVKKTAEYLLEKKCYDLAATDLHHDKHLEVLTHAVVSGILYQKIGEYPFKNKELFAH